MNRSTIFLKTYRDTGNVTKAADAAGIHRSIHYRRMKEDAKYAAAFAEAHAVAVELMEEEAHRRAVHGVEEPVIYKGAPCYDEAGKPLVMRRYADNLLMFLLRGAKPQTYRERFTADINANLNVTKFKGSLEELLATYRVLTTQENGSPEA